MTKEVRPPRLLIFCTLLFFIVVSWATITYHQTVLPDAISIQAKEQPTIGSTKAKVHVIVLEEPKCPDCARFTKEVFPTIEKEFIATNKIRFTVIPVSFLHNSMPAAVALLCAYYQDPSEPNGPLFMKYLDTLFDDQPPVAEDWATQERLIEFAQQASPAIDTEKLKKCIDTERYRKKILENTRYGRKILDGNLMTPTVFVNGMKVEDLSVEGMSDLIQKALQNGGE